jgi:uncharacterized membrane protein YccC
MYVLGVVAAAAAGYVAQDRNLHPLPTAAWVVGVGIGVLIACRVAIFAVTKHWAPKHQRKEAREALTASQGDVVTLTAEVRTIQEERDERSRERDEARARAATAGAMKVENVAELVQELVRLSDHKPTESELPSQSEPKQIEGPGR